MKQLPKAWIIIIALCFPTAVFAQLHDGVRCVQDQLAAAGFDPGPSDGRVGPRTHRALTAYQNRNGRLSSLKMDETLGNAFCRLIGLQQPALKEHWPTRSGNRPIMIFGKSIGEDVIEKMNTSVNRVYGGIDRLFDLQLAGRDVIVVANGPIELKGLLEDNVEVDLGDLQHKAEDVCGDGFSLTAAAGIVFVCVDSNDDSGPLSEQQWLDLSVAQAVMTTVQFQLTGSVRYESGQIALLNAFGPAWLSAGSARAFGHRVAFDAPEWLFRGLHYEYVQGRLPNLAELELDQTKLQRTEEVYVAGMIAAVDLVDLFGYPAIGEFYSSLGRGIGWEAAFEGAFGITVGEFYNHYNNVVRFDTKGKPIQGPLGRLHR